MVNMWGQRFLGSCCNFRGFFFHKFCYLICLILSVCNVSPSFSLATPIVSKAFSFVDLSNSNVLSFINSIVDPTLVVPTILKAFYFISSTIEPTLSFVSPTFSWTFSIVSPIFSYTIPKNLVAFCFNCSKIEPTLESYSSWVASYWASSFLASSSLCGFSSNAPKVEAA